MENLHELKIERQILISIIEKFKKSDFEVGFVLGSKRDIYLIDNCAYIRPLQDNKYVYIPDTNEADKVISDWSKNGIIFTGFIHSHIVDKEFFTEADLDYAEKLLNYSGLKFIWFGLITGGKDSICNLKLFQFYEMENYFQIDYSII